LFDRFEFSFLALLDGIEILLDGQYGCTQHQTMAI